VDGNIVENIGAGLKGSQCQRQVHGIYVSTSGNTVTNNIVRAAVGYGIHLYHDPNDNVIANNDVDHSGEGGILVGADGDTVDGVRHTASRNLIANNISRDNGRNDAPGYSSDGFGIREYGLEGPTNDNRYLANDLFNNPRGWHNAFDSSDTDLGQMSNDPLYVDYAHENYHLQPTSPAIDAGVAVDALSTDFDLSARPRGAHFDVGAYEAR
jgi:parallel beta-helix repeat protein